MPEPAWTRIGIINTSKRVPYKYHGRDTGYDWGLTDLYVEVYKVENCSLSGASNYACVPRVEQWPGKKLDNGWIGAKNEKTKIIQDWSENNFGGLNISDWGPVKDKTGHLDWSLNISPGDSINGGVSASYDVPYIAREDICDYNETVAHKYTYPSTPPIIGGPEAKNQVVELESIGEAFLDEEPDDPPYDVGDGTCDPWPDLLHVNVSSTFAVSCGDSEDLEIDIPINKITLA